MFSNDQHLMKYFDWPSTLIAFAISLIGLLFIFSATYHVEKHFSIFFIKQTLGLISGFLIYTICCTLDYRTLLRWGYFGYIGILGLLTYTLAKGSIGMGAQRWISLGFIRLQPSELAKLFFPIYTTYHLHIQNDEHTTVFRTFMPVLCVLALSFILILKQPDLGTALIIVCTGLLLVWLAGIPKKFFLYTGLTLLIGTPFIWHIMLRSYQKKRIEVFLGYGTQHRERYQIEQATIAIGSGGITGKGLLHGTQNKLKFLPESRTDFIFAVLCEEWGLTGALFLLLLYVFLFTRMILTILVLYNRTIQLCAFGIIAHILLSTIINLGMVTGLLPIVGIPLPLVSYGVSNLWVTCASLGCFARITMQQQALQDYVSSATH